MYIFLLKYIVATNVCKKPGTRAVGPHSLYADPDPAVFLNTDPDPDPNPNPDPDPEAESIRFC